MKKNPDVSVTIGKLHLANPVMVASGTFGYMEEFKDFLDCSKLGAIVTKTITVKPRTGNPAPRTCETPAGMLNSIGLENPGVTAFIEEKLEKAARVGPPVIVSIASEGGLDEFAVLTKQLDVYSSVAAFEVNISCPNVKHGAAAHERRLTAQDAQATAEVITTVRGLTEKTIIAKLSPNVTDIVEIAQAAESAGADAICLVNTLSGMSIDVKTRRSKIAMISGGLSGPAIRPVAVRMVWELFRAVKIPLIGTGGITDTASALEFLIAGATAVSVGTQNFINPRVTIEIIKGLREYLIENDIADITALTGSLQT
ncbi:MAG TPA: dihydroorotate dehydrogenase [Candidatus Omnitrophota bacterium]|nr:dihydroorotate dehydrogenase [Candidatus Omnitrophota bacterium]